MSIRVRLLVRRERAVVGANAAQLAEAVWQGLLPRALAPTRFRPLVDVWETAATVHARVELAGVPEGSLVVGVADDVLVVEGDRPWAAIAGDARVLVSEIPYGPFRVELPLPARVDAARAQATYQSGFLHVVLPKEGS